MIVKDAYFLVVVATVLVIVSFLVFNIVTTQDAWFPYHSRSWFVRRSSIKWSSIRWYSIRWYSPLVRVLRKNWIVLLLGFRWHED